ncbi:MAG: nucleotidyltransferase family protein [Desulfomonilaceae bacterium]
MHPNLSDLCIAPSASIREAMACIDRNGKEIVLIADSQGRLVGTVTDGDIRRAILAAFDLDSPVKDLLGNRACKPSPKPVTALEGTSDAELLRLMKKDFLRHIPLLDDQQRLVDLVLLRDLVQGVESPLKAVVMAGGYGIRLRPLTEDVPKPMLPVGDKPLLERIIGQLRESGIRSVHVATHYKKEIIEQYFGDGRSYGVQMNYVGEGEPLGTAGALCHLADCQEPLLVINGDVLTSVDFRAMMNFHEDHSAHMTIAVKQYNIEVPYGVIETNGVEITGISEKPVISQFVNAGIYLLSPGVCSLIPEGQRYDIPDLVRRLLQENYRVVSFPVREYWQDIGKLEDYERALSDYAKGAV